MTSSSWTIVLGFLAVCATAFVYDAKLSHDDNAASGPPAAVVEARIARR